MMAPLVPEATPLVAKKLLEPLSKATPPVAKKLLEPAPLLAPIERIDTATTPA